MRAGLDGHAGTHNPYIWKGSPEHRDAWGRGQQAVEQYGRDSYQMGYEKAQEVASVEASAALRAQAEAEAVEPWRTIPLDIAQMVVATGRAQWADTEAQDAQGHGAAMTNSVQLTAETFGQTEPQPMQLLVIEGTDTVLGYMGTSPNSPVIARAMTGAWNWLHEQSAHALAQAAHALAQAGGES